MVEVLACNKCEDCKHWEIVRDATGKIHLHCKTCETLAEIKLDEKALILDATFHQHLSDSLESIEHAHWINVEKE